MSDKLIKLTDRNMRTHDGSFQWELGKKHEVEPGKRGTILCTNQVFHAYRDVDMALLLNPMHACIPASELRIFEAEGQVVAEEWDKVGTHELTLIKELTIPEWYADVDARIEVCVKFATYAAADAARVADAAKIDFIGMAKLAIKEALNEGEVGRVLY